MTSVVSLPLYGFNPDELAINAIQWFAKSVARRALQLEPAANAVFFAVARIARNDAVRCEYAFVLSEDANTTWPFASSPKHNAMLDDGRSPRAAARAIRDLYGADTVDLGHGEGQPFYRAFARFSRDPRTPDAPMASAFAPVVVLSKAVFVPGSWEARNADFGLRATRLATVHSPECEEPARRATTDDPRDYLSPLELVDTIQRGSELRYSIQRATTVRERLDRYRADPSDANLQALRESLGIREAAE